jgi:hypothetical protein
MLGQPRDDVALPFVADLEAVARRLVELAGGELPWAAAT